MFIQHSIGSTSHFGWGQILVQLATWPGVFRGWCQPTSGQGQVLGQLAVGFKGPRAEFGLLVDEWAPSANRLEREFLHQCHHVRASSQKWLLPISISPGGDSFASYLSQRLYKIDLVIMPQVACCLVLVWKGTKQKYLTQLKCLWIHLQTFSFIRVEIGGNINYLQKNYLGVFFSFRICICLEKALLEQVGQRGLGPLSGKKHCQCWQPLSKRLLPSYSVSSIIYSLTV